MMNTNEYSNKIDKVIGIILTAVEMETSVNFIGQADFLYDVAKELYYEFDANFEEYTENLFDEILAENEILSLAIMNSQDGVTRCFLQEVFDYDGNTLVDDYSDVVFIEDEYAEKVDIEEFTGQIVILVDGEVAYGDVEEEEEEVDSGFDTEEDLGDVLALEFLATLGESDKDDLELTFDLLSSKLSEAYNIGYFDGATSER